MRAESSVAICARLGRMGVQGRKAGENNEIHGELSAAALLCAALGWARRKRRGPAASTSTRVQRFRRQSGRHGDLFRNLFPATDRPSCTGPVLGGRPPIPGARIPTSFPTPSSSPGIDLALPGPIAGTITLRNSQYNDIQSGLYVFLRPDTYHDEVFDYTGSWNGTVGAMFIRGSDNDGSTFQFR